MSTIQQREFNERKLKDLLHLKKGLFKKEDADDIKEKIVTFYNNIDYLYLARECLVPEDIDAITKHYDDEVYIVRKIINNHVPIDIETYSELKNIIFTLYDKFLRKTKTILIWTMNWRKDSLINLILHDSLTTIEYAFFDGMVEIIKNPILYVKYFGTLNYKVDESKYFRKSNDEILEHIEKIDAEHKSVCVLKKLSSMLIDDDECTIYDFDTDSEYSDDYCDTDDD